MSFYPSDPQRIAGGVEAVAYHLAAGLGRIPEIELHVLSPRPGIRENQVERYGDVTVHRVAVPPMPLPGVPNMVRSLGPLGRALCQIEPDVINGHTPEFTVAALRAGFMPIYTIHGVAHGELRVLRNPKQKLALLVGMFYTWLTLRKVEHVIASSPYIERTYRHKTQAQFHRIDNPVDDRFFVSEDRDPPSADPPILLWIGTLFERKDPLTAVAALARVRAVHPNVQLHFVGRQPDSDYAAQVRAAISCHGLEDNVVWHGLVTEEEKLALYRQGTLLLLSSREETAPIVISEALAGGLPVVATRVGGVPDLIIEGKTGYLADPEDPIGLADGVLRILADPPRRAQVSRRAVAEARRRFQRDAVAARYASVYQFVTRSRHSDSSFPILHSSIR